MGLKKILFFGFAALLVIGLLEALSFVVMRLVMEVYGDQYIAQDYEGYAASLDPEEVQAYADAFHDPDLGWLFRRNTVREAINTRGDAWVMTTDELNSRGNPYPSDEVVVSLYGDSFTFSDEVNDDETWQYFLSVLTDSKILNFGMGAFGTDQAVRRLELNLENGLGTPVVVLGVYAENIKRILNAYRPYYIYGDPHVLGFKPVYEQEEGDSWRWVLPRLKPPFDTGAIERAMGFAAKHDHFHHINEMMPDGSFPYLLSLIEYTTYGFRLDVLGEDHLRRFGGDIDVFWGWEVARERMRALMDRFVQLSKRYAFRPVIVFFPEPPQLRSFEKEGFVPGYRRFAADLNEDAAFEDVLIIDLLDSPMSAGEFNIQPYEGHPSPYGNKVIASFVYENLRSRKGVEPFVSRKRHESGSARVPGAMPGVHERLWTDRE